MPGVLIAGCGYVGIATAKLFRAQGWDVTAWSRSGDIADGTVAVRRSAVDLRDRKQVRKDSFPCDLVVQCASSVGGDADEYRRLYRDGAANLVACFPQARIFFVSSTSVYSQKDGAWVDEESAVEPMSPRGKILREAENIVLEAEGVVLRVGGIYGPGRSFLLQSVLTGTAPSRDTADRFVNEIHRDDVASAIFFLARQERITPPRIFNVVDNPPVLRSEILHWLSAKIGKPLSDSLGAIGRRRADSNKRVSNAKLRALGWSPHYPSCKEGFLQSVLPESGIL
jgi:nucleoside-diphosphate-sugar epimerase